MHGASLKDEGEGFVLPKCTVHSRETRWVHGAELKAKWRCFKALGCVHAFKEVEEGAWFIVEGWMKIQGFRVCSWAQKAKEGVGCIVED